MGDANKYKYTHVFIFYDRIRIAVMPLFSKLVFDLAVLSPRDYNV